MKDGKIKMLILVIIIIMFFTVSLVIIGLNKKEDKYKKIEKALENVFYYLPSDNYDNLSDISDYCKIALIYDTNYIKSDYTIYDDGKKIKGYTKDNLLSSIKNILGNSATIDFEKNESGDYGFLKQDSCMYNDKVSSLTYDEGNKVVYNDSKDNNNNILMVDWFDEKEENNIIRLKAHALIIAVTDKSYDLYVDNNMEHKIESYQRLKDAMEGAKKNYNRSYIYSFELKLENGNYVWTKYNNNSQMFEEEIVE